MTYPEKFGFCMAGNERPFIDMIDKAVTDCEPGDFVYYEVGIGNGDTMAAVNMWLTQREISHQIIGIDLPNYRGGALEVDWNPPSATFGRVSLVLTGAEQGLAQKENPKANYAFIDACHGAPCVTRDFLGVEKLMKKGGIVCFHDTDPNCQGIHFQDHCGTGIDARRAVEELGLLNDTRPGWKYLLETHGDKSKGGHGALWVQYVG